MRCKRIFAPLAAIMKHSRRRLQQHGSSSRGEAGQSVSNRATSKQPRGRSITKRQQCKTIGARRSSPDYSPSPSCSESSPEPSPARKSRRLLASSSPSSPAAKGKGAAKKGHHPLPPQSPTPSKKVNMQLGSDATPSTEVSIFTFSIHVHVLCDFL